jgi:hypothetical protein
LFFNNEKGVAGENGVPAKKRSKRYSRFALMNEKSRYRGMKKRPAHCAIKTAHNGRLAPSLRKLCDVRQALR